MASVFDNPNAKSKCQIFTPNNIVIQMLDSINYKDNLYGKKIIDHSCGNGHFLTEIVCRYIVDCKKRSFSNSKIQLGLSQDIWGIELDKQRYEECIQALEKTANKLGIDAVNWKVFNSDSLRNQIDQRFDYVVGNPPYLSYWDIPKSEREFIKDKFTSCKNGACDYCFAFIETAFAALNETGILTYIIPSSIFKTNAGKTLRETIKPYIQSIYDYKSIKIFDNALTSSAIIVLQKSEQFETLSYFDATSNVCLEIDKASLGDIWVFTSKHQGLSKEKYRFGDYFKVSSSVATQYNKAFVLIDWEEDGLWLKGPNGECVEKRATRKAASPKGRKSKRNERIIFPYYYENRKIKKYSENQYKVRFPFAYKYLLKNKERLLERDADEKAAWFEYGRSQALEHLEQEKILLSSVITDSLNIFKLDDTEIPYSGLYIVPIKGLSIDYGIQLLNSKEFKNYVSSVGVNVNGNSIRITAKNISDYNW